MRLSIHQHDTIALTPHLLRQRQYADSILAIGEGRYDDYSIILDTDFDGSIMKVGLAQMKYFLQDDVYSALMWLYPDGFHHQHMKKTCILACKNEFVDAWNALGKVVQVCASTTLAATLYENATTAHSLFKYPVEDEHSKDSEQQTCYNLKDTQRLELLQNTHVIVWDEFVSNNRELFEAVQ